MEKFILSTPQDRQFVWHRGEYPCLIEITNGNEECRNKESTGVTNQYVFNRSLIELYAPPPDVYRERKRQEIFKQLACWYVDMNKKSEEAAEEIKQASNIR